MILVDSSVWIDFFRGAVTPETEWLDELLQTELIAVGDIILTEVLQGFGMDRDFDEARVTLEALTVIQIVDRPVAVQAARHYRQLRELGVSVRKTVDTLIATRCIEDHLPLLYSDRDFDAFVEHLGLRSAMTLQRSG